MKKLSRGELAVQLRFVGHVAEHALGLQRLADDVKASQTRPAAARLDEPGQHFDRGGLAGAVGSQETKNFTSDHLKRQPVDRKRVAEALAELVGLDEWRGHRLYYRSPARGGAAVGRRI